MRLMTYRPPSNAAYSGPLVINSGGTYTGNWRSTTAGVPAVDIQTSQPVVLQDCRFQSVQHCVKAYWPGADVTLNNCIGMGLAPASGTNFGRFLAIEESSSAVVTNCTLMHTAGIYVSGLTNPMNRLLVARNVATDIESRNANGFGGYSGITYYAQFVQCNSVYGIAQADIEWNQVISAPSVSRPEDLINMYQSSAASGRRGNIRNNFIHGSYPNLPVSDSFSGGGIIVDGNPATLAASAGYWDIYDNQIVSTTNHGIAIASGHDNLIRNNRCISSGKLNGQLLTGANVGIYIWNGAGASGSLWFNNSAQDNWIGWTQVNGTRNDTWFPDGVNCTGNTGPAGEVTTAMEQAEWAIWQARLASNGVRVGSTLRL